MRDKNDNFDEPEEEIILISRTKMKHEVEDLQRLGVRMADLSSDQLKKIDIPEELRQAILFLKKIPTGQRGALKRERQHIGALMRKVDPEPIELFFKRLDQQDADQIALFKQAEKWRDDLIAGNDNLLTEIIDRFPACDRQQLRQLSRGARQEMTKQGHFATDGRNLFRELKKLLEAEAKQQKDEE